jgi:hypothetical protein
MNSVTEAGESTFLRKLVSELDMRYEIDIDCLDNDGLRMLDSAARAQATRQLDSVVASASTVSDSFDLLLVQKLRQANHRTNLLMASSMTWRCYPKSTCLGQRKTNVDEFLLQSHRYRNTTMTKYPDGSEPPGDC